MTEAQLVFRPLDVSEVVDAVRRASAHDRPLTVISGGHGPWSHDEPPGMTIHLGELEAIMSDWQGIQTGRLAEYGNFADTDRPAAVREMFSAEALQRLREIKRRWDPDNLFRRNHNIVP